MPNSSPFSLPQLRNNRFVKVMLCFVLFSPILWLVYTKSFTKSSRRGKTSSEGSTTSKQDMAPPGNGPISKYSAGFSRVGTDAIQDRNISVTAVSDRTTTELIRDLGNFEPPDDELPRSGPGEEGKPHKLSPDLDFAVKVSQSKYGMNMVCSDEISLDRTIPDLRIPECKHWNYPENLPNASVVIVFHNEGFSTLMRTVHSVVNRTPSQLLAEVLLVDDYSDKKDLKDNVELYIQRWNGTVKVIRNEQREGLINTRSRGAREAHGDVIVFLDAHCEVNKNWLPPLLAPIHKDRTTLTVPVIDGIDSSNFEVRPVYQEGHLFKGIFEWGMLYKEKELSLQEINARANLSEPYKSPTHAGGLFAINREYFLELGAYDPGLLVWGGENFELSFKIWQCGGSILWVPCSRVAHVYRSSMPYSFRALKKHAKGPLITINYKRVVETWMDDKYKEYFYTREPIARFVDMGDISEQLKLKKKLECKSFQWYMDNVAGDLTSQYPELPPNTHWGAMKNVGSKLCLDTLGRDAPTRITILTCSSSINYDQLVRLNTEGQLGIGENCVDVDSYGVKLELCKLGSVSGPWQYNEEINVMYHNLEKMCLAVTPRIWQLSLEKCDLLSTYQQWQFTEVRP